MKLTGPICAFCAALPGAAALADAPILGSWCGDGDEAIWLGPQEAVLGEHAFCRWDPPYRGGDAYQGVLHCRTTVDLTAQSVEHPLPIRLSINAKGGLIMQYSDTSSDTFVRCPT